LAISPNDHLRYTSQTLYDKGWDDVYFVAFCAVAFTVLREIILRGVMKPFASYWLSSSARKARLKKATAKMNGVDGTGSGSVSPRRETKREIRQRDHTALRFAEQGWSFAYCTVSWSLGMVSPITRDSRLETFALRSQLQSLLTLWADIAAVHPPPNP
jgi:acyl-CoA-dependent ceramide synthase